MKRKLLTLLFALIGLTSAWSTDYDLYVSGTRVTSTNASDLSAISGVTGTVYYTVAQNTLYLSDATIMPSSSSSYPVYAGGGVSGLKINVTGVNTIVSTGSICMWFNACGNVEITGGGTLTVRAEDYDIFFTADRLTISNGTSVYLLGGGGIDNDGNADETLEVNNANLFVRRATSYSCIRMQELVLTNAYLALPLWSSYERDGYELQHDGQYWKDDVCIRAGAAPSGSGSGGKKGDVNGDGNVTIADVTRLVNIILHGGDGNEYVDLGLPSGTLWATCNVGATKPEGYGDYFAWGETTPKSTYNWSTYKYCNGSYNTQTKYCTSSGYGTVDNKTELELSDDAAYVNWGSDWRMPSDDQFRELINSSYTTTEWTTVNGIYGRKITSNSNGSSIFLPAAGYYSENVLKNADASGNYWSRTLAGAPNNARYLRYSTSASITSDVWYRFVGHSVRPVRASQ